MGELPKSFLVVTALVAIAAGLTIYFVCKAFLFRYHKAKGNKALQQRNYAAALDAFRRAEALWELNVTKQTRTSYQRDLANLDELLCGVDAAARARGIDLPVSEYRRALQALQAELQGVRAGVLQSNAKSYASAFMHLKTAQSMLREQLRASQTHGYGKKQP